MNHLNFIKGKGLITKDIDSYVVSAWFEISIPLYEQLHKYLDKVLNIEITLGDKVFLYTCNIDTSSKNYLSHHIDHGIVRIDIHLKDLQNLIMCGTILCGDIKLLLNK